MAPCRNFDSFRLCKLFSLGVVAFLGVALLAAAEEKPKPDPLVKPVPENVEDLKAIQSQVKIVLEKVLPCVVCVQVGPSSGSGVIVSKEGHVLTAGHVSGKAGQEVSLVFPDGKKVKGKTLGANKGIDSGMIQISQEGNWPFVEMGKAADLKPGQWCIALGHPGGYKQGRTPPLRLGRVLSSTRTLVQTDCTLVGGDSGGPLFDLEGRVIGIHSRIGGSISANIHVPVDTYRDTWDRLVNSEVWGGGASSAAGAPYIGVQGELDAKDCRLTEVAGGSPAEKAGLRVDDVVTRFDGRKIAVFDDLVESVRKKKPGDEASIEVARGGQTVTLKVVIGKRP